MAINNHSSVPPCLDGVSKVLVFIDQIVNEWLAWVMLASQFPLGHHNLSSWSVRVASGNVMVAISVWCMSDKVFALR